MKRGSVALAVILLLVASTAEARRRAVRSDPDAPYTWLLNHAHTLQTTEQSQNRSDLEPLRSMIGDRTVVGLGDGTHGTHEFYTVKIRIIDFLVREMGFDVVAIEGAFPLFEKINVYTQGGAGDPRALLAEANSRLSYFFWDVEELLELIEWMRDYNLHRDAGRPAVELAGADIFDQVGAAKEVIAFLRAVDPTAADAAERDYACVLADAASTVCLAYAQAVRDRLEARIDEFTSIKGARSTQDALQYATVILQNQNRLSQAARDQAMARNTLWIRDHRGTSKRVVLWAHQEHVARLTRNVVDVAATGWHLGQALGDDYFVIGTVGGSGTFGSWEGPRQQGSIYRFVVSTLSAAPPESYEWDFAKRGARQMLIPLRGDLPPWLSGQRSLRGAGVSTEWLLVRNLADMLDAVVYVETTSAVQPLVH